MGYWNNPDKNIFTRTFQEFDATVELDDNNKWCASIQIASWETPAIIGRYNSSKEAQNAINDHFHKLGVEGSATCDCCNTHLDPENIPAYLWLEMYGPESWSDIQKSAILFEWSQEGVYCSTCQEHLLTGIIKRFQINDRYSRRDSSEQIRNEIKIIKSIRGN